MFPHPNGFTWGRLSDVQEYARDVGGTSVLTRATHYTYDLITGAAASVTQLTGPNRTVESTINHEYYPATGQLLRTYTSHNDTVYGYDAQGRLEHVYAVVVSNARYATFTGLSSTTGQPTFSDGTPLTSTYVYDEVGDLQSVTLPIGDVTTYDYDDLNRLHQEMVTKADGTILDQFTYTLRGDGLRESVAEHRLTKTTVQGQQPTFSDTTISWVYDDDGRLKSEFHDTGTPTGTANVPNDADDYLDTYSYDLNGNRITKSHVFCAVGGNHTQNTDYQYDSGGDDHLETETMSEIGQSSTSVTDYFYDANGSTTEKTVTLNDTVNGTATSTVQSDEKSVYDLRNHLVRFDANGDTQYDANGNPLPASETGDIDTAADDTTYGYDTNGNRIEKTDATGTTINVTDESNPTGYEQVLEENDGATGNVKVS